MEGHGLPISDFIDRISDPVAGLDAEWRFTHLNRAATRFFGESTVCGTDLWSRWPHLRGSFLESELRRAVEEQVVVRLHHEDARQRAWEITVYPHADGATLLAREKAGEQPSPSDRLTEAALRRGEERFRQLAANSPDTLFSPNRELRYLEIDNPIPPFDPATVIEKTGAVTDVTRQKAAEESLRETQKLIERVVEISPDIIYVFELSENRTVFTNRQIRSLLGYEPPCEGRSAPGLAAMDSLIHPDDQPIRDRIKAGYGSMVDDTVLQAEFRVRDARGAWRWIRSRETVFRRAPDGRPSEIIGFAKDISDQKAAEEALREGIKRFELISRATNDAIWDWDFVTNELWWNDGIETLFGYDLRSIPRTAEWWHEQIHPEDRPRVRSGFARVLEGERDRWQAEYRYRRSDGSYAHVFGRGFTLRHADGRPIRMLGGMTDITSRKLAEEQLRQLESQQRIILDHLPVGVWFADATGHLVYSNPAGKSIWPDAHHLGAAQGSFYKAWWHHNGQRVQSHEWAAARAVHQGETSLNEVIDIECFDGARKTILNSAVPVKSDEGDVLGAVVFNQDITERMRSEQALQQSEARLRTALDAGQLGAWEWDIQRNKVTWTERLYQFHGLPRDAFDGTLEAFSRLVHPEDAEAVTGALEGALAGTENYELEFRIIRPDGTVRWLATRASVLLGPGGAPLRMIGITQDLTSRKQTELALREAQDLLAREAAHLERLVEERTIRLQEIVGELEAFSYSISHDMRAPLRAMRGYSEILLEDHGSHLNAEAREYLHRIASAGKRLDGLIQDVLTYSRVTRSDLRLNNIHLDRLLRDIVQQYPGLQPPHAEVEIVGTLLPVLANEAALTQCLSNLLGNAAKFVPPGVPPRIRVSTQRCENGEVRIWVEDNGIGIAQPDLRRIWGIFERLHPPDRYSGTGIGLSIVRKAVERMGGSVGAESQTGKGSRFWIQLQRADEHEITNHPTGGG